MVWATASPRASMQHCLVSLDFLSFLKLFLTEVIFFPYFLSSPSLLLPSEFLTRKEEARSFATSTHLPADSHSSTAILASVGAALVSAPGVYRPFSLAWASFLPSSPGSVVHHLLCLLCPLVIPGLNPHDGLLLFIIKEVCVNQISFLFSALCI